MLVTVPGCENAQNRRRRGWPDSAAAEDGESPPPASARSHHWPLLAASHQRVLSSPLAPAPLPSS